MSTSFATRNKVQSLDRALEMLKLLGSEPEMRVTDLARRLEVHKSTAFRLLWTLQEHGLVEQNPTTERYRLGYGLVRLAGSESLPAGSSTCTSSLSLGQSSLATASITRFAT